MNSSKNRSLLNDIKATLNTASLDTNLSGINSQTSANGTTLTNINSNLSTISTHNNTTNTTLSTISSTNSTISANTSTTNSSLGTLLGYVNEIKTDVDTLAKTKIVFNARLTDGTNEYLDRLDYSGVGNAIDFYWQNDKGTPVYITQYKFCYQEATEPTMQQLYHSTAWDSKIGAMNSAGTDYEAPYITVKDNIDYFYIDNTNDTKKQWVSNIGWVFPTFLENTPIEIGISRKFGHHINANMSITYDSDPVGIIEGYYYSS